MHDPAPRHHLGQPEAAGAGAGAGAGGRFEAALLGGATLLWPGSSAPCWPAARFAAVARLLGDAGEVVVVGGGPRPDRALEVAARADLLPARIVVAGEGRGVTAAALIGGAGRVVTDVSAVAELAEALGTPSVLLCASERRVIGEEGGAGPCRHLLLAPVDEPGRSAPPAPEADPRLRHEQAEMALLGVGVRDVLAAVARLHDAA